MAGRLWVSSARGAIQRRGMSTGLSEAMKSLTTIRFAFVDMPALSRYSSSQQFDHISTNEVDEIVG